VDADAESKAAVSGYVDLCEEIKMRVSIKKLLPLDGRRWMLTTEDKGHRTVKIFKDCHKCNRAAQVASKSTAWMRRSAKLLRLNKAMFE